jgi:hypothetical protein
LPKTATNDGVGLDALTASKRESVRAEMPIKSVRLLLAIAVLMATVAHNDNVAAFMWGWKWKGKCNYSRDSIVCTQLLVRFE